MHEILRSDEMDFPHSTIQCGDLSPLWGGVTNVARPHTQHLDDSFLLENLANKSMLDVGPPRERTLQVSYGRLVSWGRPIGGLFQDA
jgi:hypothetical protein